MNKQAMQVYFDKELVDFYKQQAKLRKKSFAAVVREVLDQEKRKVEKIEMKNTHKTNDEFKKAKRYASLVKTFNEMKRRFGKGKYYHPELTDDELLYGK